MTALARLCDIDAELLSVHALYLKAERRGHVAEAAELWIKLDHLLEQRILIPLTRLPSDADGHTSPGPLH